MQPKISSFFKYCSATAYSPSSHVPEDSGDDELTIWEKKQHTVIETYTRRAPKSDGIVGVDEGLKNEGSKQPISGESCATVETLPLERTINKNKKRSYAQVHLEFGQSDFLLRTCSTCGIKYTPGEKQDEKAHTFFHNNFIRGIPFHGWQKERIISVPSTEGRRIIMVLDSDPSSQRKKVQEVIKIMESELGCGWIYHKLCKVYLFISSQRIAGCLVAEPIKEAFVTISSTEKQRTEIVSTNTKEQRTHSTALQFGNILFEREVFRRVRCTNKDKVQADVNGAIYCGEAVPAICGVRAIWVTPMNRRNHIATQLLDAARKSFSDGFVLEYSQLAFLEPTSAGKALASSYMGSRSLLVYRANNSNC